MTLLARVLVAVCAGLLSGWILGHVVAAQAPSLVFARNSATGAAMPIGTTTNALNVIGK